MSSYLLKPMQRITKYQLLLRDLCDSSNVVCGRQELEEALKEVLSVVKVVNDSIRAAEVVIRGLPAALGPLGVLSAQQFFQVATENKGQSSTSQLLFARNRLQRRQVFVYDSHVVFCKPLDKEAKESLLKDKSVEGGSDGSDGTNGISGSGMSGNKFQFKFALATAGLGMSTVVRGDDRKMELWVHGRTELYTLEARSKKAKEEFGSELRKVILKQKEHRQLILRGVPSSSSSGVDLGMGLPQQQQQQFFYADSSSSGASAASFGNMIVGTDYLRQQQQQQQQQQQRHQKHKRGQSQRASNASR